jgi:acetyl-CoA acetyltransferase
MHHLLLVPPAPTVRTSNIAREAALGAGFPDTVPAHTVTMACISACQAVTTVASMINSGQIETAIAGGAETMSDVPIRFSKEMRKRFIASQKYKKPLDWLKFLKGFKLGFLAPEAPAIAEFSTGEVMGHSSDRLVSHLPLLRPASTPASPLSSVDYV